MELNFITELITQLSTKIIDNLPQLLSVLLNGYLAFRPKKDKPGETSNPPANPPAPKPQNSNNKNYPRKKRKRRKR
ncbi:hypothetical protein AHMF7616_05351 [Adhaeribacter pallidiroseus]|uniref:Uncharacterized protein n=1 Tax=Adhaeribacter pallidiroseus TaxID=2072847 RepID=A0A369Q5Z4_9BACT|nr:hypothetical protein AHMF7616_05307 [Adhaeribacter pallidiroseus]RDC58717.1 hypothetical protein AHMF7616_05351 [Adhaeribacter pallidiroseus]